MFLILPAMKSQDLSEVSRCICLKSSVSCLICDRKLGYLKNKISYKHIHKCLMMSSMFALENLFLLPVHTSQFWDCLQPGWTSMQMPLPPCMNLWSMSDCSSLFLAEGFVCWPKSAWRSTQHDVKNCSAPKCLRSKRWTQKRRRCKNTKEGV